MNHTLRLIIVFLAIVLGGCSKVGYMSVKVIEPAAMPIPAHIKKVALVDRSSPPRPTEKVLVGAVTGEDINRDQSEAQEVLWGINNTLNEGPRLQSNFTGLTMTGSQIGGTFPLPLDTSVINKICREHDADGVIVLETYSSNRVASAARKTIKVVENGIHNGVLGALKTGIEESVNQQAGPSETSLVKVGFRFYDKKTSKIFDQCNYSYVYNWFWNTYVNQQQGTNQTAYNAGQIYARRISPTYIWVGREYYKRSKNSMIDRGIRMANTGDWSGAAELWKKAENQFGRKKAGRASYNLALAYEVMGDLEQAQVWCDKSDKVYKNKLAEKYSRILKERVAIRKVVQQQLNAGETIK